ncbi:hypothetical protein HMSSN036_31010 [Paenibacillus macerans]|nr:hypothetical protein HMSSN036_31010 [Paenibacillus macerans]
MVNEQKEIPESALQAVLELKRKGIETVIATGRAPYFITKIAEQLGIDSFVCLNGAYVVYKGRPVVEYTIPKEHLEPLVERAGKHNHYLVYQGKEAYFSNAKQHPALLQSVSSLKVELPGYDPDFWRHSDVYQAFCTARQRRSIYIRAISLIYGLSAGIGTPWMSCLWGAPKRGAFRTCSSTWR